jgi:transposase
MRPIAQENNIEFLREYANLLKGSLDQAHIEIKQLKNALYKSESSTAQSMLSQDFEDQLHRLQRKFFGFGREKLPEKESPRRPIGHEDQLLLMHGNRSQPEESAASVGDASPAANSPRANESVTHGATDQDLLAENQLWGVDMKAGVNAWKKINGLTRDTVEITVTERIYKKVTHRQEMYRLKDEYNTTGKEVIYTAPGPVKVKPGMTYSVDFALAAVTDKYEMHIPLERQRRKMEAAGQDVDVKTLYSLCEAVAEHCNAVIPEIRKEVKDDYVAVHLDETPWRILREETLGQMWVMSNRIGTVYQFEPTRSGKVAEEMLAGYEGAIVTDAYGGYSRLTKNPSIRLQHCWSHARREFFERYDDFPEDCARVIHLIDEILGLEYEIRTMEDFARIRLGKSKAAVDQLRELLFEMKPKYLPGQGISKAIGYTLRHWSGLTHFLKDATVPLTNNEAERALRHIVLGRKNFLGSQTINGADTAASIYTVIETAKKNDLQPTEYLKYLITERWHKRVPLTPKQYGHTKFGPARAIFPPRSEWQIKMPS